jgi:hypothetical protein
MSSYIILCLWYTLLTGTQILEEYMEDIYSNIDFPNFKILITNAGEYLTQQMSKMSSLDKFNSNFEDVNIKKETILIDPIYTSYYDVSYADIHNDNDESDDDDSESSVESDSDYDEDVTDE